MRITHPKAAFFVLLLFLACVSSVYAQGRTATVISARANLRDSPTPNGEVKQEVPVGTKVKVLDQKASWYVVRLDDQVGWMHGNTIRFGGGMVNEPSISGGDSASSDLPPDGTSPPRRSRSSSNRSYIRGPRGGCYYLSGSGRKVYVDRSLCD